jgi:uncharacterized membrane protein YphA (DoxX/SURF4 family)
MNNQEVIKRENAHELRAYTALKIGFVVAPVVAGLDKFFNLLTDWTQYLAPIGPNMLNISPQTFMYGVGVVEVVAGIGVLLKPKIFSYVVSAWLVGIIVNLLIVGQYYDIALRDLGLAIGAYAVGEMARRHEAGEKRESQHRERTFGKLSYR